MDTPRKSEKAIRTVAAPAAFDAVELGACLREARLALQRDLDDIASELRIRYRYLQAIEEGRLSHLPGSAYTTGFLRAYGDYLGFDGREIVNRYTGARGAGARRTDLHLPSPVEEGRLPTGPVLMLAALLALGAYGGWYFMVGADGDTVDNVAALPDRLAALIAEPAGGSAPGPTDASETAVEVPASPNGSDANGISAAPTLRQVVGIRPPRLEASAVSAVENGVAAAAPQTRPVAKTAAAAVPEPPAATPPAELQASTGSTGFEARSRSATVAPQTGGGLSPLGSAATERTKTRKAARIVLQANADSWLEVRADGVAPVYSGLLRQGDSYDVPEQPGLMLMTGNAGGIDILVDGQAIARLGPPGAVKRDVALDADRLLRLLSR